MAGKELDQDDFLELLTTLALLRLEVQELKEAAANLVPRDELASGRKRLRWAGFVAIIVLLIVIIPFGILVKQNRNTAREARTAAVTAKVSASALVQDEYDRALSAKASCQNRNQTQSALVMLIQKLAQAELDATTPNRQRIDAYNAAVRESGSLIDCSTYQKQADDLVGQGATPHPPQ